MNTLLSKPNLAKDNFYELLGVSKDSTEDQILYEYRIKARELHPDKNSEPNSASLFQKIQKAKEVLTNSNLRSMYDTWLFSNISVSFEQYLGLQKNFEEVYISIFVMFSVCTGIPMLIKPLGCWIVLQIPVCHCDTLVNFSF
ncbi:DnaJ subfamily C member 12 [Schistosoma bovis]|uniref:DnaJ subfamily C member 12 n=1 Tax=Schistosoma bovis TaxID=6184 RepID=A0A430QLR8_SCHBO|nr:DnaJ subfamily C member 12 [Schistosoma bovis]